MAYPENIRHWFVDFVEKSLLAGRDAGRRSGRRLWRWRATGWRDTGETDQGRSWGPNHEGGCRTRTRADARTAATGSHIYSYSVSHYYAYFNKGGGGKDATMCSRTIQWLKIMNKGRERKRRLTKTLFRYYFWLILHLFFSSLTIQ